MSTFIYDLDKIIPPGGREEGGGRHVAVVECRVTAHSYNQGVVMEPGW